MNKYNIGDKVKDGWIYDYKKMSFYDYGIDCWISKYVYIVTQEPNSLDVPYSFMPEDIIADKESL
jgi:hypothetical protein